MYLSCAVLCWLHFRRSSLSLIYDRYGGSITWERKRYTTEFSLVRHFHFSHIIFFVSHSFPSPVSLSVSIFAEIKIRPKRLNSNVPQIRSTEKSGVCVCVCLEEEMRKARERRARTVYWRWDKAQKWWLLPCTIFLYPYCEFSIMHSLLERNAKIFAVELEHNIRQKWEM